MCGRYTVTNPGDITEALDVELDRTAGNEWWKPRFNVAPTQPAPVVVLREGARSLELMRWGLVPHWGAQPGARPPLMINARVESVGAKQVYRDALARRRCLVPADGFLEWARGGAGKGKGAPKPRPYWFHPAGGQVIAFAGLYARAGQLHSFTILTGAGNSLVAPIHDRMPIVLPPEAYTAWLDPNVDADAARALIAAHPTPPDGWRVDAVSLRVNAAANDDPACLAPPDPMLL